MRHVRLLFQTFYLVLGAASSAVAQGTPPLEMAPHVLSQEFQGHISVLRDPGGQLNIEQAQAALAEGGFEVVEKPAPDFGFTPEPIWLYIALENSSDESEWRLRLRENFFQEFAVWQVLEGGPSNLLEFQDETSTFSSRTVSWPELVVAFTQAPDQEGGLFIRYRSGGSTEVEFVLFDRPTFEQWTDRMTARNFIYYGMLIFLILAALTVWAMTRRGIFIAYAAYAVFGLLFVMHGDGNAFRFLWPDAPGFNGQASILLGAGIVVFGANFARQFLQTAVYHSVFDKLLLGTIFITLLTAASSVVVDSQIIKKVLVLLAFFSTLLFTASAINAARTRFGEVRFFLLAWSGAVISSAIMTGRHWLGLEISEEVQYDSMRIVLVLDAALMGLAILDRYNNLRRSRSKALETSLAQAERNLALSRRLQALEQRYTWAVDLTRTREQQVADAIHDLRQPLHALRINVQDMLSGKDGGSVRELEKTFSFLEQLVTQELEAHPTAPSTDLMPQESEAVALDEIMQAVVSMFEQDAADKDLKIDVKKAHAMLRLPAIAVMRILSNLFGNAVRYTPGGRVSLEAKPLENGGLRIEIHDTGPGMTPEQFQAALPRNARLEQTVDQSGSGLGLNIVAQTCASHDIKLELMSRADNSSGTSICVTFDARLVV